MRYRILGMLMVLFLFLLLRCLNNQPKTYFHEDTVSLKRCYIRCRVKKQEVNFLPSRQCFMLVWPWRRFFYSSCLTILSRSSPRLVLFHGSAQLIAILVPTLKFSTSKLSVVQGDSISSIRLVTPYFMSLLSA